MLTNSRCSATLLSLGVELALVTPPRVQNVAYLTTLSLQSARSLSSFHHLLRIFLFSHFVLNILCFPNVVTVQRTSRKVRIRFDSIRLDQVTLVPSLDLSAWYTVRKWFLLFEDSHYEIRETAVFQSTDTVLSALPFLALIKQDYIWVSINVGQNISACEEQCLFFTSPG